MAQQPKAFQSFKSFAEYQATDRELLIFRRFETLNARSLLYLQSELLSLEKELADLDQEDTEDGSKEVIFSAKCWEVLAARSLEHPREAHRVEVIRRIQDTLRRYNQGLLQQHDLMRLMQPEERPFRALKSWFDQARPFVGISAKLISKRGNFVSLKPCSERDTLTGWIEGLIGRVIVYFKRSNTIAGPQYFSDGIVQKSATFIGIVGAVLLLEVAIVVLYLAKDDRTRFGLVAMFTVLFAAAIGLVSNARRAEMFGACAAYAAVLVVFLSGNLSKQR